SRSETSNEMPQGGTEQQSCASLRHQLSDSAQIPAEGALNDACARTVIFAMAPTALGGETSTSIDLGQEQLQHPVACSLDGFHTFLLSKVPRSREQRTKPERTGIASRILRNAPRPDCRTRAPQNRRTDEDPC